jgi:type I restriction enzyme, S subunit
MTPEGWTRATLGEIVLHLGRGTSPDYVRNSSTVFAVNQKCVRGGRVTTEHVRAHEPKTPVKPDSVLRPGDVCVNSTGTGTIGRVGLWGASHDGTFFVDTHVMVVRPNPDRIVSKFLSESLLSSWVQREMEASCFTGSTNQVELSKSAFIELALLLPPLAEQRKIAAILSSVDDATECTQAVIDQLGLLKKAMMAEVLARGLPGRHSRLKQTEIGLVPEGWDVVPLGTLLDSIDAGWSPLCESAPAGEDEWGVLKVSAVSWGEFRPGENKRLPANLQPRYQAEVRPGDLLVSRANTPELVGRCVLVRETRPKLMMSDKLMRLRVNPAGASPGFLRLVLETTHSRHRIEDGATGSSRSMKNISQEKLRTIWVPHPSIEEQGVIARVFDMMGTRLTDEASVLNGLRSLKSALMSVLLTGEVRVKPCGDAA